MRNTFILAFAVLLFSCNQSDSKKEEVTTKDQRSDSTKKTADTLISKKNDTASLVKTADEILTAAKLKDYEKFGSFIHPDKGARFYPSSYIDTSAKKFSGPEMIALAKQKKKIDWGSGFAEPEKLTVDQYFGQCIYDNDYLKVGKRSVNDIHRGGTAEAINVKETFAGHDIVEYFFPGTAKNGNMDWSAVRLVFEMKDNTPYLIGVVYDHWTP